MRKALSAVSAGASRTELDHQHPTAPEALRTTETDGLRLPEAEEALRAAMHDPLGIRLPASRVRSAMTRM